MTVEVMTVGLTTFVGRALALAGGLALTGCIQAAVDDAPCPCAAPAICCAALDRCVDTPTDCPEALAPALRITAMSPQPLPKAGGALTLTLDPPIDDPQVHVGGLPCPIDAIDGAQITCRATPNTTGDIDQPVRVDGRLDDRPVRALDTVRYRAPPFVDVSDAAGVDPPLGQSITVARLFGQDDGQDGDHGRDLIFARGSVARQSGRGSQLTQSGPLRWTDISAGGVVDGLAALVSITPVHLDDDDVRDLIVVWGSGDAQNGQVARGLDGATQFETSIPVDLPKLTPGEGVRLLPITLGREAAVLGVRTDTDVLERSLFLAINGVERLPAPFTHPDTWTAESIVDLALIDANGDARPDLVTCAEVSGLFEQTADGFGPPTHPLPNIFLYCNSLAVGDLDLDGRLDLIALGTPRGNRPTNVFQGIRILRGTAAGFENVARLSPRTACDAPIWVGSALPEGVGAATVLDADLDGDLDIFVPSPSSACPGPPVLYINQVVETGTFDFIATSVPTDWTNPAATAVVADDLDGDGDLDLVYTGWGYGIRGRVLRNTAVESGATGRGLAVRVFDGGRRVFGAQLAADLDNPTDPDFEPGPDRLRVAMTGHTATAITDGPTLLPLGPQHGALALRVTWPDGYMRVVDVAADQRQIDVDRDAE